VFSPPFCGNTLCNACLLLGSKLNKNLETYVDLVWCYKILFGIVEIQAEDFFLPSTYAPTRGHQYKLFKKPHLSRTRANFFRERIVNAWNLLADTVDFSVFKLLLWYVPYVLYNCYILCICVLPYSCLKSHRKSLSEPGASCSTSMSLVCTATSLFFEQIKLWWWRGWTYVDQQ